MGGAVMTSRQAAELDHAFERNGFTPELVKHLSAGNILAEVRNVLLGFSEIKRIERLIDCDADPFISDGWSMVEHRKSGTVKWDPAKQVDAFYLSENQKKGGYSIGSDLRKELANEPVLNACVLDYLLKNPHLIPESWKGKAVFFWGTIYRNPGGSLYVRCIYWGGDEWHSYFDWLGGKFGSSGPAALLASQPLEFAA